jgi:TetR/AcrR family transcriptional repressor of nem operon
MVSGKASMSARSEQKERSRKLILESAARLIRERGISGAGVAEAMKGADLTVGGFYAHFASKKDLVDEALRHNSARLRTGLFDDLDEQPEAARAGIVLQRYLSADHRDWESLGCPLPAVVGEVGTTAPQHRTVVAEQLQRLVDGVSRYLPRDGIVPRRALAIGLAALMYGGLSLSRAVKGTDLSDEVLRACRALGNAVVRAAK